MNRIALYLGLGALFTHELDAVANHEWRVMPLVRDLPDELGMTLFVAAHVPLFAFVVAWVASPNERVRTRARVVLTSFLVLHGGLHVLFMGDPRYEFSSALSNLLIFGGAVCGAVYLASWLGSRRDRVA